MDENRKDKKMRLKGTFQKVADLNPPSMESTRNLQLRSKSQGEIIIGLPEKSLWCK